MSEFDEGFVFDGYSGLSCEAFVRLVRQYAFSKDRGKDDEWIAQFASTRMDGAALRWLEDQPEDTQDSWKLLRRAVLIQWPPAQPGVQPPLPMSSNAPTPAAAPPQARPISTAVPRIQTTASYFSTTNIRGRIRITSTNGAFLGYIGRSFSKWGYHLATRNASDAVQADFLPSGVSGDVHEIQLLNSDAGSQYAYLGVTWDDDEAPSAQEICSNLHKGTLTWGALVTVVTRPHIRSSATDEKGPSATSFWNVLSDGAIVASYKVAPKTYVRLSFVMGNVTGSLSLTNSYAGYAEENPADYTEAKFVFEPL